MASSSELLRYTKLYLGGASAFMAQANGQKILHGDLPGFCLSALLRRRWVTRQRCATEFSFKDTINFEELQTMAKQCSKIPEDSEREETCWLERLVEGRRSRKREMGLVQHR
jgi:hypothetical protein